MIREARPRAGDRPVTRLVVILGAVLSLGLTLYAGRHNPHMTLQVLFAGWVTAPYLLLGLADWFFTQRPGAAHGRAIRWLGVLIGGGSAAVYLDAIVHPRATAPAAPFVVVPLVAFLAIVLVIAVLRLVDASKSPG